MSNNWTSGYVADVGYTYGYYGELNPLRTQLAFLSAGLVPPAQGTACELGFGQGISVNIHAAATAVQWHGTDFNPSQAAFAQHLAASSANGAQLHDDSFAEFAQRDLPQFDFIGLHGIWSWISDENRHLLVDFLRRKLKVGGVVYISYNTLPGWAKFGPLRQLMAQHAAQMAAPGEGFLDRIKGAVGFIDGLLAVNPLYAQANSGTAEKLASIKGFNPQYVAHEFFNKDWVPMYFAEVDSWLSEAKLSYACSAQFLDHIDVLNLTQEQQKFLNEIPSAVLRQGTRDFMLNQQFRRDYWVKGTRQLSQDEQLRGLRALRVVLGAPAAEIPSSIKAPVGEAKLSPATYGPIIELLADYQPRTLGEIEAALKAQAIPLELIVQSVLILAGVGKLWLAQDEQAIAAAESRTAALNQELLSRARGSKNITVLSSPVTGEGIGVSWVDQLFLLARAAGMAEPQQWADYAWPQLLAQGQRMLKDGKVLDTEDGNRAYLLEQAGSFAEQRLPVLLALKAVR